MPTNHLYHTLIQRIRELHPNQRRRACKNSGLEANKY